MYLVEFAGSRITLSFAKRVSPFFSVSHKLSLGSYVWQSLGTYVWQDRTGRHWTISISYARYHCSYYQHLPLVRRVKGFYLHAHPFFLSSWAAPLWPLESMYRCLKRLRGNSHITMSREQCIVFRIIIAVTLAGILLVLSLNLLRFRPFTSPENARR